MPAAIPIMGAVAGAGVGIYSANKAAKAQQNASNAAISSQERMLERQIGLTEPQRQLGYGATNELARLFGYGGPQQQQQPFGRSGSKFGDLGINLRRQVDGSVRPGGGQQIQQGPMGMNAFMESPDYQFRKSQGLEGIAQTLGAGGQGAFSGNALRGLNEYNSNLASGEFGNYINRRLQMAGLGQTANFQAGNQMGAAGANIGNSIMDQGNARASGILGAGSAINNGIWGVLNAYGNRGGLANEGFENIFSDPGLF